MLGYFTTPDILDAVDDDKMSGIRYCPPSKHPRIADVRRWWAALLPEAGR